MVRVAAVDCGTNSLRLLVADVDPGAGVLQDVDRQMEIVRLGEGVDRTGRISDQALSRTMTVTRRYAQRCHDLGVERIRFVATSASRDAQNRDEFMNGVRDVLGVVPEVIDGDQEASLSFDGATRGLPDTYRAPFLVVDIGGGSTEFVLGESGTVLAAQSVDIGCVRLTERLRSVQGEDPLVDRLGFHDLGDLLSAADQDIEDAINRAAQEVPLERTATLIGLAGSVTTVTAHALGLPEYDARLVHGADLPVEVVVKACDDLIARSPESLLELPYLHPGRVDVIRMGALVWRRVIERVADESGITRVLTSEYDILDGIAWSVA
jgi:exopolyphosphatase / guanosine-5'-triphosphate,3'-diphosphate pyrophosphatase